MPHLNLQLLGQFTADINGTSIENFRSEKERALLAYLAMHAGEALRREHLAALLWPNTEGSSARRNLRLTLHRLREALDKAGAPQGLVTANRSEIRLEPELLELDADRFTELLIPCSQT